MRDNDGEHLGELQRKVHRTKDPHRVTRKPPAVAIGDRPIMRVHILDQIFRNVRLILSEIPAIISIWEIEEGRKESIKDVEKRIQSYLPGKET